MAVRRRALLRLARAFVARGGVLVVAVALLLGIARGGARYFYCPMMGQTFDDACCASAEHDEGEHAGPSVEAPGCCQAKRLGTLPSGATVSTLDVPAVPLAAVLPPFDLAPARADASALVRYVHPARDGPPYASERRAMLMVWTS